MSNVDRLNPPISSSDSLGSSFGGWIVAGIWALGLSLLGAIATWMLFDPQFEDSVEWARYETESTWNSPDELVMPDHRRDELGERVTIVKASVLGLLGSQIAILLSLFWGPISHRRMLGFLGFVTFFALSIGLLVAWKDVVWQGERLRVARELRQIEQIAGRLDKQWPLVDGNRPGLGPFSAYPYGQATVLMRLHQPDPATERLLFTAVERAENGALRFRLAGVDRGYWLEKHPEGSSPSSFQGGLEEHYELRRSSHVKDDWYLAQYSVARSSM